MKFKSEKLYFILATENLVRACMRVCVCAYVKYFTTYSATNTNTITADNIFLQEIFGSSLYSHCFTSVCKFVDFFVASVRMWWSECVRLKWIIII